jgi:hypothetical protein
MVTTEESSDEILLAVFQLWSRPPQDSPVLKKWRDREEDLGTLPSAPAKAQLPVWLQKSCCASSSLQRVRSRTIGKQPPPPAHPSASLLESPLK